MVKVHVASDCGNAPKKLVLRDYSIALVEQDKEALLAAVADGVEWDLVGRRVIQGKADFADAVDAAFDERVAALHLDAILTHGHEGAVTSRIEFHGDRRMRCCDVYTFTGHSRTARIKRVVSYWIEA